ncbi:MAG: hypothetical protein H6669_07450 [Ardenticatenaceae bacterium]|nr:hypothetical protein [Ardenticatenaceae bacterium]
MKQKLITAIFTIILSVIAANTAAAQGQGGVAVTIRVRQADGAPLVGEKIMLVRPPEDEPVLPICTTGSNGECAWFVGRGLYTLHFETIRIDPISILGPAEAGLTGLSITVGDEDISYSFAIANENHIYFDQAPDAPIPEPFIPTLEDVQHDHYRPTPEATPQPAVSESTPGPATASPAGEDGNAPPDNRDQEAEQFSRQWLWSRLRFLLVVLAGCLVGFALFMWQQRRQRRKEKRAALTTVSPAVEDGNSPILIPPKTGDEFFNKGKGLP